MNLMKRFSWLAIFAAAIFCSTPDVDAAEITAAQARTAVRNWRIRETAPMGAEALGHTVRDVSTVIGIDDAAPLFHVVRLAEGGFVVTSADDGINPIVAFSGDGDLDPNPANPLWALLNADLSQRKAALAASRAAQGMAPKAKPREPETAEAQWAELLDERGIPKSLQSVSDVRVSPFVQSRWAQDGDYNRYYFTMANGMSSLGYPAGCIGVCGAQIMRYFRYPTSSVTPGTYTCAINGVLGSFTMKGGYYSWADMPNSLGYFSPDSASLAISKLISDVAIASQTDWRPDGSSATMEALTLAFTERFQYRDAKLIKTPGTTEIRNAILANLDFGMPVAIAIKNPYEGHAAVVDGYGYSSSVLYCHLNMGWEGAYDAWYNLPLVDTPPVTYNGIASILYNLSTEYSAGAYWSGRILDQNGNPAVGATYEVMHKNGSKSGPYTVSNGKGIYALHSSFSGASETLTVNAFVPGYKGSASVTLQRNSASTVGNRWGVDVRLNTPTPYVITLNPNGGSGGTASVETGKGARLPSGKAAPVRPGYSFQGFFTTSAATGGTQYYDAGMNGTTVWDDTSITTLYARWTANTYTVTLSANGGTGGTPSVSVVYGTSLPSVTAPSRMGYAFTGYFDAGGTQYYSATMTGSRAWDKPSNTTLLARWTPNAYSVTFDACGGTVTPPAKTAVFDTVLGVLPVPALDGLYFAGWWTEPDGAGTRVTRSARLTAEGLMLYAYWVSDPALTRYRYLSDPDDTGHPPVATTVYEGFIYDEATTAVRGTLTLSAKASVKKNKIPVTTNWTFTAKAILQNATVNFSAKAWNGAAGDLTVTARTGETLTLRVEGDRFWGMLEGGAAGGSFYVDGARNAFVDRKDVTAQARLGAVRGYYTMALCGVDIASTSDASGYLTLTVGNFGSVKIAGKLPDGTAVSGSGRLMRGLNGNGWLAVAFFKPLFLRKGCVDALLWLDPQDKVIRTDRDDGWFARVRKADGSVREFDVAGGFYNPALVGASSVYGFSAHVVDPLAVAVPGGVLLAAANGKLVLAGKATMPKLDKATGAYVYDPLNPAQATFTFTPRTGLFKGTFKLWHDTLGANGKLTHKAVSVPHAGVIVTTKDAIFADLPLGAGHCLVPGTNRTKQPWPVWVE